MADGQTPFGTSQHTIPRRERAGGEVILPQLLEGEGLDLLREINEGIKQLNVNMALIAQTIAGAALSDSPLLN